MSEPNGWTREPLGCVANLIMGQSPESKYYSEEEIGLPFLQGCAEFGARFPTHVVYCSQPKKVGPRDSILFSVRAPVGRLNIADRDYIIGRGLAAIIGSDVDQRYLEYFLRFEEANFQNASQGSTFKAINSSELSKWPVDFPCSSTEQSKIAEILSTVDRAIEQTEALIAKQQRLKAGLMQDLLTRGIDEQGNLRFEETHKFSDSPLGRIPVEWDVQQLQGTCQVIDSLHHTPSFSEDGFAMVRVTDIKIGELSLAGCVKVTPSVFREFTKNHVPKAGDIVISRVGTYGVSSFVETSEPFCLGQNTVVITGHEDSRFLFEFLQTPDVRSFFDLQLAGSSQKTLSLKAIRETPTPVVDSDEMSRIVNVLRNQNSLLRHSRRQLRKLRLQKTALMQDLLTGEKRVTPLLEPAPVPSENAAT